MRFSATAAWAFALLFPAVAIAQEGCAQNCFNNATVTECTARDWPCLCKDSAYIDFINDCIPEKCGDQLGQMAAFYSFSETCQIFGLSLVQRREPRVPAKAPAVIVRQNQAGSSLSSFASHPSQTVLPPASSITNAPSLLPTKAQPHPTTTAPGVTPTSYEGSASKAGGAAFAIGAAVVGLLAVA